jgi:hypothetical protein
MCIRDRCKLVLDTDVRPIVKTNAVRMMNEVARIPYPPIADTFVAIINEKQKYSDAYKNYAFTGLKILLSHRNLKNPDRFLLDSLDEAQRLKAITEALDDAIRGKNSFTGQPKDVVQFIRRNAISAMGSIPEASIVIRQTEVLARPALTLYQVMVKDPSIVPEPSPAERFEALVGLCNMTMTDPGLNLDVLAFGMNNTMIDLIQLQGDQAGTKQAAIPWRFTGARLTTALNTLIANAKKLKNDREPAYMFDWAERVKGIAATLEVEGTASKPEVGPLSDWKTAKAPKNTSIYKGIGEAPVKN